MTKMGKLLLKMLENPEHWERYAYGARQGTILLLHKPSQWVFEFTDEDHTDVPQYPCLSSADRKVIYPVGRNVWENLPREPFGVGNNTYRVSKERKQVNQDHVFKQVMAGIMQVGASGSPNE